VEWPDLADPAIGFCGSAPFQSVVMMNARALVAPTGSVQGGVNHRRCDPQPVPTRDSGLGGDSSRRANNRGAALQSCCRTGRKAMRTGYRAGPKPICFSLK
jgi:hypothetical protein